MVLCINRQRPPVTLESTEEEKMIHKRRRWIPIALMIFVMVLGSAGLALFTSNETPRELPTVTGQQATPDLGIPREPAQDPDNIEARYIKAESPAHYKCQSYPSDDNLRTRDLVPTANVVAILTYNRATRLYNIESDPRINIKQRAYTAQPNGSDTHKPYREIRISWTYASGVAHYDAYWLGQTSAPGNPYAWFGMNAYDVRISPKHQVNVTAGSRPQLTIVASDSRTCNRGPIALPSNFEWSDVVMKPDTI